MNAATESAVNPSTPSMSSPGMRETPMRTITSRAAFVCVTSVEALTHAAVLHRPEILSDGRADAFIDEVTGLVLRYLRIRP
jgi:hypothetical protein